MGSLITTNPFFLNGDYAIVVFLVVIGGLLLLGGLFGLYNYVKLSRIPVKDPTEVSTGETVAMEVTVSEQCPTVTGPFSQELGVLVYWQIKKRGYDDDGEKWLMISEGVKHPDILRTYHGTSEITVTLPANMDRRNIPETSASTTVERGTDPLPHIQQCERDLAGVTPNADSGGEQERVYREARFEQGEPLTVYGCVEPTSGDVVSSDQFKLTPNGDKFMITRESPAATKRKRILGSALAFCLAVFFFGIAFAFL